MDVWPGEIIHMDENGAVKFPANKLEAGADQRAGAAEEEQRQSALQNAKSAKEIRAIFAGLPYDDEEE